MAGKTGAIRAGRAFVELSANDSKLRSALKRVRARLRAFGSAVARIGGVLARLGGIAAGAAVAGMGLLVKQQLSAIDSTAKLADRIGTSTEAISGLQFAAEQTGAGAKSLAAGLDVMAKRLGEVAIKGSGAAAPALEKLGLEANELIKLDPAEQFTRISEGIAGLGTASERGAVTANIFSRANQGLVNTLALGREGLAAMRQEAERLGTTFSETDADKVEAANDAMNRVKTAITGAATQLTVALAPAIESVANFVVQSIVPAFASMTPVIDDIVFLFQNFGDTAKLTLLNVAAAALDFLGPSMQEPIEQTAAVFVGAWEGVKAFFATIVQNIVGGLKEIRNFALAVGEGIAAAFAEIKGGNFKGAASAFSDAFVSELASQTDVDAPNAFSEFNKAFREARDDTLGTITGAGGLDAMIDQQRDELLNSLARRRREFEAERGRGFAGDRFAFDGLAESAAAGQAAASRSLSPGSLQATSQEGLQRIAETLNRGRGQDPNEQTAKSTKQIDEKLGRLVDLTRKQELRTATIG